VQCGCADIGVIAGMAACGSTPVGAENQF
jgi:hypothetical protein